MKKFVIDPRSDNGCHGKYERSSENIPDDWVDIVEVDDLSEFAVINWRYEQS